MRLIQFLREDGHHQVAMVETRTSHVRVIAGTERIYDLALEAGRLGVRLEDLVLSRLSDERLDYDQIITSKRLLSPLDHPDPAHCLVTGTGLTHLGSAQARDAMHTKADEQVPLTDSMRLFQAGLKGGKPDPGQVSVQPEWFYKGSGYNVVPPEQPLISPPFALDGGEEAELVGLYVVSESGDVLRVGFALGNEFSDHIMEAQNYLYLAHSKLRPCSFGPELLTSPLPTQVVGLVRILRDERVLWEAPFQTGEDHMSFSIASLEHHHFKYELFRQPGDVHIHFLGASALSCKAGIATQPGDCFEISAPGFGQPLRNPISKSLDDHKVFEVKPLYS